MDDVRQRAQVRECGRRASRTRPTVIGGAEETRQIGSGRSETTRRGSFQSEIGAAQDQVPDRRCFSVLSFLSSESESAALRL